MTGAKQGLATLLLLVGTVGCSPTVRVEAPSEPQAAAAAGGKSEKGGSVVAMPEKKKQQQG